MGAPKKTAAKVDGGTTPKLANPPSSAEATPRQARPRTAEMVTTAIREMKERTGSSLHAIKKFIESAYSVDVKKLAPFIKRYIKRAVRTGDLVQISGTGASGSFTLPKKPNPTTMPKTRKPASRRTAKKTRKPRKE